MLENLTISLLDETFARKIADLDVMSFTSQWDEKQWLYEIKENPCAYVMGVLLDGQLIAYIDYWITFDSSTIAKLCVKKEYRHQGIATLLMDQMMKHLKKEEVLYLTLEVRVSNVAAINLYKKYGFKEIVIKNNYYADGEDASYMVKGVNE